MSGITPEELKAILANLQPSPQPGAITGQGIIKWQTIIITVISATIGLGAWLVKSSSDATAELVTIKTDIVNLKEAAKAAPNLVKGIDDRQRSTEQTVQSLKEGFDAMGKESKEVRAKMEKIEGDVAYVRQQITLLTVRERGR